MSIFSDLHRNQNQEPERIKKVVGDVIDEKQIDYEQVLTNIKDILINWSRDLVDIKNILDNSNDFFNTKDEDVTLFISKLKGDLFSLDYFGIFDMNHVYDLLNELKVKKGCPDYSPLTGTNNTCHVTIRELDDKRSVIRTYNTRLKGYRRDFNDIWGRLLKVRDNNLDDKYTLYTTGTTFNSLTSVVNILSDNYGNMKGTEGKLVNPDTSKGLISNIALNENLKNTKINILNKTGYPPVPASFTNTYSTDFSVDDYVNIDGVLTQLGGTAVGAWSCWVKPVDAASGGGRFLTFGDTNASTKIEAFITTGGGRLRIDAYSAGVPQWRLQSDTQPLFSDNTWAHLAVVQDGISPVFYFNGVASAQTFIVTTDKTVWFNDLAGLDNGRIACINHNNASNTDYFNGMVDEVSVFTSAKVIGDLWDGTGTPTNLADESGLVGWWRMGDGDTFPTITDNSSNSNDGTMTNMEAADFKEDVPT